ncbi:hypothetical protein [Paenibacillus medicaginis]|uniref:Uncharacterized protein n=1 Tax=Paenibacillus medicaginis TaxID=1470560 RepID=A0ABV5BUF9_9BACL
MIQWTKYDPKNPYDLEEKDYLILLQKGLSGTIKFVMYNAFENVFEVDTEFGVEKLREYVKYYAEINLPEV